MSSLHQLLAGLIIKGIFELFRLLGWEESLI